MKLRIVIAMFAVLLTVPVPLSAERPVTFVPLPADLNGELDGVPYRICVPENWNGTLLVYAYGYAEAYPSPPLTPLAPQVIDADMLLAKGFALAGILAAGAVPLPGAQTDAGWNFKERMQNTAALTAAFREMVGQPQRTIIWGKSMGGLVALGLIEKFPGLYDGAVALCAPAAGTPRVFDQKIGIMLAYAVAFGWNDEWGTPGNLRADLNFMTEVYPRAWDQRGSEYEGLWEFFRLVNRIPYDKSFYGPVNFRFQTLWLSFVLQVELNKRAGGRVGQNLGIEYTLTGDDKAYLWSKYQLDAEPLLKAMNESAKYASEPNARNYAEHYFNPSGRITRPVLTLHTTGDAAAIPNNESAYRTAVENQGKGDLLVQLFSTGNGVVNMHCSFPPAQYLAGIDAMVDWINTGNPPDPSSFPSGLGFNTEFVPELWPW